jgi:hypothetical protein
MNLYYAVGGGMGHLTRTAAFFYSFNLNANDFIIIVSSTYAEKILTHKNYIVVPEGMLKNGPQLQQWLSQITAQYDIKNIYIDTFPAGLYGEWNHFPASGKYKFFLISRLLNWKKYIDLMISPPHFETTYIFESLDHEQHFAYKGLSLNIRLETLKYPPAQIPSEFSNFVKTTTNPIWLIVHSETQEEVLTLYNQARDVSYAESIKPVFAIVSPCAIMPVQEDTISFNFYPAHPCFEKVDKIFTACGFNAMQQTANIRHKHVYIPLERRFDDQFLRATLARSVTP